MYLGLDVHAEDIAVAIAEAGRDGEVRNYGEIANTFHSIDKLLRELGHPDKELRMCYEAGPGGFVLARFLKKKGIACDGGAVGHSALPRNPCPLPPQHQDQLIQLVHHLLKIRATRWVIHAEA